MKHLHLLSLLCSGLLSYMFPLEIQSLFNTNFWAEPRLQLSGRLTYLAQPPEPNSNCSVEFVHWASECMKEFILEKLI